MKAKIVRIGNSRGVRIPKPLLEEAGLEDEVQLRLVESGILIEGMVKPRAGWADAALAAAAEGDAVLLDDPVPTDFDDNEWEW